MPDSQEHPTRTELAKDVLLQRMRNYSEKFHCAGWLGGLEFLLWEPPMASDSPWTQDRKKISEGCRILGEIAGGWWVYEDETRPGERGPVFIPMERWQQILAQHGKRDTP